MGTGPWGALGPGGAERQGPGPSVVLFSAKLCLTLGDPLDCSTPGFPVLHQHLLSLVFLLIAILTGMREEVLNTVEGVTLS